MFDTYNAATVKEVIFVFACRGLGPLINPIITRNLMMFNQMIPAHRTGMILLT